MIKKILLTFVVILALLGGYAYLSTRGDKSVKGNEGFGRVALGETLSPFTLKDQFDRLHTLTEETKKVIFVFKKDPGHVVRSYLNRQKDNYLQSRRILFVADISKMPAVIREYAAMPDLRKRDYPVLTVYNQGLAAKFKQEKEETKIMVADLDRFRVTALHFAETEEELGRLID
jgi:hypothetical protein